MSGKGVRRARRRVARWLVPLALASALTLPTAAAAQEQAVLPVVTDEAVAVVDGAAVPADQIWSDPAAAEQTWTDPAAAPVDGTSEGWVADPNAVPVDAAPVEETWAAPAVPVDQLPAMNPSLAPPPSTGNLTPGANWVPPTAVYVAETGQAVSGAFLDVWRAWGAALSWGFPITPEIQEDGKTVQYYAFGRFEWTPDDPNGIVVQFGDLGAATRPFMLRRGLPGHGPAIERAATAARAWAPLDPAEVAADTETSRFIPETGHTVSGDILAYWVQTGEAGYLGNPVSEPYQIEGVTYQVFERGKVAQEDGGWPYVLPIGQMVAERYGIAQTPSPQGDLPTYSEALFSPPPAPVPGVDVPVDPNGERRVLISLSQQYLWAYQGDVALWQGYVSTGRAGFETPPGTFYVLSKLPVQTMEGVLGGEYYNVPNVPDVMYFTDVGHALHGTYWHNNFGTPMSHGCVNLPLDVAGWMYAWAPMGMRVDIVP